MGLPTRIAKGMPSDANAAAEETLPTTALAVASVGVEYVDVSQRNRSRSQEEPSRRTLARTHTHVHAAQHTRGESEGEREYQREFR